MGKYWGLRIFTWLFSFFCLWMILGFAYIVNKENFLHLVFSERETMVMIYLGALSIWQFFICMMFYSTNRLRKSRNGYEAIFSFFGMMLSVALYFIGAALIYANGYVSSGIFGHVVRKEVIGWLFYADLGMFSFVMFCYLYFWRRMKVPDNTIIIYRNELLYPGDQFFLRPFTYYDADKLEEIQKINVRDVEITCSDVKLKATIVTKIRLGINEAKSLNIKEKNRDNLLKELNEWTIERVKEAAESMTAGQLLTNRTDMTSFRSDVSGFPFFWDGQLEIFNPVLEGQKAFILIQT